ncbi:MAG: PrsW family intramembrane metalloprotease [Lachnospiraceae bacterium]|nr:PrsW family intramembrane metalloprotease [Lachnospiraceae bacterium]
MILLLFGFSAVYFFVYILAAVIPAILLMIYVYRKDRIEQEPVRLVGMLMLYGALSGFIAMALEALGEKLLPVFVSPDNPYYMVFFAFLVVAAAEEGVKFFFLKRKTWNDPNLDHQFDGIVYAAAVSMGFAAMENIGYVFSYGISVAPIRAFLSIPGHMAFAVAMGVLYGRARLWENRQDHRKAVAFQAAAYLAAVFLHGFYDACAMMGTDLSAIFFIIFVVVTYIGIFFIIKRESRTDRPLE